MSDNDKNIYFWPYIYNLVPSCEYDIPNSFGTRLGMTPKKGRFLTLPQQCVSADFSKIIPGLHRQVRSESKHHLKWKMFYTKYCKSTFYSTCKRTSTVSCLSNIFEDTSSYCRQDIGRRFPWLVWESSNQMFVIILQMRCLRQYRCRAAN